MQTNNKNQFVYLLREREFINSNKNIYKVGMTKKQDIAEI